MEFHWLEDDQQGLMLHAVQLHTYKQWGNVQKSLKTLSCGNNISLEILSITTKDLNQESRPQAALCSEIGTTPKNLPLRSLTDDTSWQYEKHILGFSPLMPHPPWISRREILKSAHGAWINPDISDQFSSDNWVVFASISYELFNMCAKQDFCDSWIIQAYSWTTHNSCGIHGANTPKRSQHANRST